MSEIYKLLADLGRWWYNFRTLEYEMRDEPPDQEEMLAYIPQTEACRVTYRLRMAMGDTHLDAAVYVLERSLARDIQRAKDAAPGA